MKSYYEVILWSHTMESYYDWDFRHIHAERYKECE